MATNKILIVEDSLITVMHLEKLMSREGYEIVDKLDYAEKVREAVEKKEPELILMDIMLNGTMTGIEAAEDLREISDAAIIFISALSDMATINRIELIRNSQIIQKPFDPGELLETANDLLD